MAIQNSVGINYLNGSDVREREDWILKDVSKRINFKIEGLVSRSAWWGSTEIGAFHYVGKYQGKNAVLKIQGVKLPTSEAYMINEFGKQNRSKKIRPPNLYAHLAWDEERRYEALILEEIKGSKVINTPTNEKEVSEFYDIYAEYRKNCLNKAWIEKPTETYSQKVKSNLEKWQTISHKLYPNHQLREKGDKDLLARAVSVLVREYTGVDTEFVHGHLSENDFYHVGNQIVVLSNLYWSWRVPFYDAIFCYHWYMFHLNGIEGITPAIVEVQRSYWLGHIYRLAKNAAQKRLLDLALLERLAAGLFLDGLSSDVNKPISKYLMDRTRELIFEQLKKLG